jgi:hypothetical protein
MMLKSLEKDWPINRRSNAAWLGYNIESLNKIIFFSRRLLQVSPRIPQGYRSIEHWLPFRRIYRIDAKIT